MPEKNSLFSDRQRVQILHHVERGEYEQAFGLVNKDLRSLAVTAGIQENMHQFVMSLLEDPAYYQQSVREALQKALDPNTKDATTSDLEALSLLVFHPANLEMARIESERDVVRAREQKVKENAKRVEREKTRGVSAKREARVPPFVPFREIEKGGRLGSRGMREVENRSFSAQEEQNARAVLLGSGPFAMWAKENAQATIHSYSGSLEGQATIWLARRKLKARRNLEQGMTLDDDLSNAYFHPERTYEEVLERAQETFRERGFAHLTEQIFRRIIEEQKSLIRDPRYPNKPQLFQEIWLASKEEDYFEGIDLFVKTHNGMWVGIDVTMATGATVEKKVMKGGTRKPLNLFYKLKQRGEVDDSDFETFKVPVLVINLPKEIFREITNLVIAELRKNPSAQISGIVSQVFKDHGKSFQESLGNMVLAYDRGADYIEL